VTEYVVRFLAGGLLVSMFAVVGDIVRSKSFAGLFEAAPSVALATLGIAWFQHGGAYAASGTFNESRWRQSGLLQRARLPHAHISGLAR
jgi:hypothetical protein